MKRGAMEHPKVYDLCERLRVRRPTAIGCLEMLWHFAAKYAPQGDVGRFSDTRIEAALDWSGRPGKLVEALANARWLDRHPKWRLVIHDWHDHADDSVRKRLARAGLPFLSARTEVTGQAPDTDRKTSSTHDDRGCLPEPEPEPEPCLSQSLARATPQPTARPATTAVVADRFPDFIAPFPRCADEKSAFQNWISRVTPETVDAAFACRDRYLVSDEVARGVITEPWKFIVKQADNGWSGKWQTARANSGRQAAIDAEWEGIANGTR